MSGILGAGGGGGVIPLLDFSYDGYSHMHALQGDLDLSAIPSLAVTIAGQNQGGGMYGPYGLGGLWVSADTEHIDVSNTNIGTLMYTATKLKHLNSYQTSGWFAGMWPQYPVVADLSAAVNLEYIDLTHAYYCAGVILPTPAAHVSFVGLNDTGTGQEALDAILAALFSAGQAGGTLHAGSWIWPPQGPSPQPPSPGDRKIVNTPEGHKLAGLEFAKASDRLPNTQYDNYWVSVEQRDSRTWYLWHFFGNNYPGDPYGDDHWFVTDFAPTENCQPPNPDPQAGQEFWNLHISYGYGNGRSINALNGAVRYEPAGIATDGAFDVDFRPWGEGNPPPGRYCERQLVANGWSVMTAQDNW